MTSLAPDHHQPQVTAPDVVSRRPRCAVCKREEAIYTCPRCSLHSCSAACSASHKTAQNCTGERNKAAYVPMNKYTWGTMMNDYVFLEEMGRRVGDWGKEIVRGSYMHSVAGSRGGKTKSRGSVRGNGRRARTKRDILKLQLEARDIEMELLPHGMERSKKNQSCWDFKKKTGLLTIGFKLHPPSDSPSEAPFRLLTHRNDINTPLLKLTQALLSTAKKSSTPAWAKSLILPDADNPELFTTPHFVMAVQRDAVPTLELFSHQNKQVYYRLDPAQPLAALLKGTRFVEYPTIEIHEEFKGTIIDSAGALSRVGEEDNRRMKRRKLSKTSLGGLLGDYGSGEDGDESRNVSAMLAEYNDSTEDERGDVVENELSTDEGTRLEDADEDAAIDPTTLLHLLQEAKRQGQWAQDDEVDWGESSEGEPG